VALENTNEIDAIGIDIITGVCTLAIIDNVDWFKEEEHLLLLQEKMNSYLRFIESGEIYSAYEPANGKQIEIKIYFAYAFPASCQEFIQDASNILSGAGFQLAYQVGLV